MLVAFVGCVSDTTPIDPDGDYLSRSVSRYRYAPVSFQGRPVWVGHVGRDAGVKFSHRFWPPTTHVIDPAVDEARFYVEQDLLHSRRIHKIGLVAGVGAGRAN